MRAQCQPQFAVFGGAHDGAAARPDCRSGAESVFAPDACRVRPRSETREAGRAHDLGPGDHDEAVVSKVSIGARYRPAVGFVAHPGPWQPVPPIETDFDPPHMAVERQQGVQQFGLIPRDNDETRKHWPASRQGRRRDANVPASPDVLTVRQPRGESKCNQRCRWTRRPASSPFYSLKVHAPRRAAERAQGLPWSPYPLIEAGPQARPIDKECPGERTTSSDSEADRAVAGARGRDVVASSRLGPGGGAPRAGRRRGGALEHARRGGTSADGGGG